MNRAGRASSQPTGTRALDGHTHPNVPVTSGVGIVSASALHLPPIVTDLIGTDADAAFLLAVHNGSPAHHWNHGGMASIEVLTDRDIENITAYMRSSHNVRASNRTHRDDHEPSPAVPVRDSATGRRATVRCRCDLRRAAASATEPAAVKMSPTWARTVAATAIQVNGMSGKRSLVTVPPMKTTSPRTIRWTRVDELTSEALSQG